MEFEVMTGRLKSVASKEKEVKKNLNHLLGELESSRKNLQGALSSSASASISRSINNVHSRLGELSREIGRMGEQLDGIADTYARTEKEITGERLQAEMVAAAKKSFTDKVKDGAYGLAKVAADGVKSVVQKGQDIWGKLKEAYDSHGTLYYAVQYGKAAVKAAFAVAKIVGAIGTIAGTGGIATIPALCALISGMNDIWNVTADVVNLNTKNYDQIGKTNLVKSSFENMGVKLGGDTGGTVGRMAFYGIDVVGNLAALSMSIGQLKNLGAVKGAELGPELKGIAQAVRTTSLSSVLKGGIQNIKYQIALAKYAFPQTTMLLKDAGLFYSVADQTKETGESIYKMFRDGEDAKALEGVNHAQKYFGYGKNAVNAVCKYDDWRVRHAGM